MLKINIMSLRWLLVVVNLGVLGAVVYNSYNFFQGEMDELKVELPDVAAVKVPEPRVERPKIDAGRLSNDLYATPPVKRAPVKKEPEKPKEPLGPQVGGPLSTWEISSVIQDVDGSAYAFLLEAQTETTGLAPARKSPRSRGMTRRSSSNRRGARRSRASRNRGTVSRKSEIISVGDVLNEESDPSEIIEIHADPPKVVYENKGRRYVLDQRIDTEDTALSEEFDARGRKILVLTGRELDDDEQAEAAARAEAANADRRGKISDGAKTTKDKEAAVKKPATRQPGRRPVRSTDPKRGKNREKDLKEALKKVPEKERKQLDDALKKGKS